MVEPVTLWAGHISAVSPTLAEALRICRLRADFSQMHDAAGYVLGRPQASHFGPYR